MKPQKKHDVLHQKNGAERSESGAYQSKATVLWFNPIKGYGFVRAHKTGVSAFVYQRNIIMKGFRLLNPNDVVDCTIVNTDKGLTALEVTPITKTA